MKVRARVLALTAAAIAGTMGLTSCGLVKGNASTEGADPSAEPSKSADQAAGSWEGNFPKGVSPVIEMQEPGGQAQKEALNAYFAFYGDLFQAMYDKDTEQAFLSKSLTADSPSGETLTTAMTTFVNANAVPKGDMRFYNGLIGAWSQDAVQVDFCVDQRTFSLVNPDTDEEATVPDDKWQADIFRPAIVHASGTFKKTGGEWKTHVFGISEVEEGSDTYECLGSPSSSPSGE